MQTEMLSVMRSFSGVCGIFMIILPNIPSITQNKIAMDHNKTLLDLINK